MFVEVGILSNSFFNHCRIFSGDSLSILPGNHSIDSDIKVKVNFFRRFFSGFIVSVFSIILLSLEGLDCFQGFTCFWDILFFEFVFLLIGIFETVVNKLIFLVGIDIRVKDSQTINIGNGRGDSPDGLDFILVDSDAPISFDRT